MTQALQAFTRAEQALTRTQENRAIFFVRSAQEAVRLRGIRVHRTSNMNHTDILRNVRGYRNIRRVSSGIVLVNGHIWYADNLLVALSEEDLG